MRFSNEFSCFFAPPRFPFDICCVCCIIFFWDCMRFVPPWGFLMRLYAFCSALFVRDFPFEIWFFLLPSFLVIVRCPYLVSHLFGRYEVSLSSLWELYFSALLRFPYEILCFWVVMRFPYKSFCVWLDSFLLRFHCFFAVMRFLYEISCFLLRICF